MTRRELEVLLQRLCVDLGFCLDSGARDALMDSPPSNAAAFTDAVFIAEGLDPETADRHLYRQAKLLISEAFRTQASDDAGDA